MGGGEQDERRQDEQAVRRQSLQVVHVVPRYSEHAAGRRQAQHSAAIQPPLPRFRLTRPDPMEERRVVTVLFADVVGSTGMGEELDPEDLGQLLTGYFAVARDVIEEYGGTLEKFIGDAVMAIFGLPRAHDDDARRALGAALDLRDRVRSDAKLADRLPIRIGINTGQIASGHPAGAASVLVTGDAVNVAARLQQQAEPWSILIGDRTAAAAGQGFDLGPAVELVARGRSATVGARELLGRRVSKATEASFVGRENDLAQLELLARRAFVEGRPWTVTLVAPPGTGKSRLLTEFLDGISASAPAPTLALARCLPYGQRLTYQPMQDVLLTIIGLAEDATPSEVLTSTRAWLERAGAPDGQRTSELLAATVGLAAPHNPAVGSDLFAAWRTLIETAARRQPLVVAFEDLHWSSDSLLDLIDHVMQPRRDVPAMLIATARPELLERRPGWGSGQRNQTTIELAPLDAESVATIVGHLLPAAEPAVVATITRRAEGNPFFASEIVRSVSERAATASLDERLRLAQDLPDTVQGTIQTRLDSLAAADRRVLQIGAVLGRSFDAEGVAAMSGIEATQVSAGLERLIERDLLTFADGSRVAARHVLIRDVAYHSLPRLERARAHAAAARWLARRSGTAEQESAELIAFHYREAATLLRASSQPDGEQREISGEAVAWLRKAAETALGAAASADAAEHLQAAIALAEPTELPDLYERLGDAELRGELTTDSYRRALDLGANVGLSADARLRLLGKLVMQLTRSQGAVANRPSNAEMADLLSAGRDLLDQATDQRAVARFLIAQAFLPFWSLDAQTLIDVPAARASAERGLQIAEEIDDPNLRSAALDGLSILAGDWPAALGFALRRVEFGDRLELSERIDAHAVVTWSACISGRLDEAERASAAGLLLVPEQQAPSYALHLAAWRAYVLRLSGRWDEVDALVERAIEFWTATGRSAAGYAVRGFVDALEIARARRHTERVEHYRGVLVEILHQFPPDTTTRRRELFIDASSEELGVFLEPDVVAAEAGVGGSADFVERAASRYIDDGGQLAIERWLDIARVADKFGCRLVLAQALRGAGLATGDVSRLRSALTIAETSGALPLEARLGLELGTLAGDDSLTAAGTAGLRRLGDAEYLDRH